MSNSPIHHCPACGHPVPVPAGALQGSVQCPLCWIQSGFDFRQAAPSASSAAASATPWWMDEDAMLPVAPAVSPNATPVAGPAQAAAADVWPTPSDAASATVPDVVAAATATAQLIALLASQAVDRRTKVETVTKHMTAYGNLTGIAQLLWTELSHGDWRQGGELPLLLEVLPELSASALARLLAGAPAEDLKACFYGLIEFVGHDPGAVTLLTTVVAALDEERFCELLGSEGVSILRYPRIEPAVGLRLLELLRALPADPPRFATRWRLLRTTGRVLPDGHERLRAWHQFRESLDRLAEVCRRTASRFSARRVASDKEQAARELVAALENATPEDWYPACQTPARRQEFLCQMLGQAGVAEQDLPKDLLSRPTR